MPLGNFKDTGNKEAARPVLAHGAGEPEGAVARQLQRRLEQVHGRLRLALAQARDAGLDRLARRPRPAAPQAALQCALCSPGTRTLAEPGTELFARLQLVLCSLDLTAAVCEDSPALRLLSGLADAGCARLLGLGRRAAGQARGCEGEEVLALRLCRFALGLLRLVQEGSRQLLVGRPCKPAGARLRRAAPARLRSVSELEAAHLRSRASRDWTLGSVACTRTHRAPARRSTLHLLALQTRFAAYVGALQGQAVKIRSARCTYLG
jgi:hypothetical protein